MRFDPGKAWPHPVLRPPDYGDDYPRAEFEVEIEVSRIEDGIAVELLAEFQLSDPDLLKLVDADVARYVLLIRSPKTHFRESVESSPPEIRHRFFAGSLSGRVEFTSFLICTQPLYSFHSTGWHNDFDGRTFDIDVGAVLAEDTPKEYWIDTADNAPIGSLFEQVPDFNLPDGRWECRLDGERIQIVLSPADSNRYARARSIANNQPDAQYLMNGLYLPALITVLERADRDAISYQEYRWFSSLNDRLESLELQPLGIDAANRLVDAQKLLDSPFPKMPLLAMPEGV